MTPAQARLLADEFGIAFILDDPEEVEWFQEHKPDLLDAYRALAKEVTT